MTRGETKAAHTAGPWTCFYKHKYDEWHVALPVDGSTMKRGIFPHGIPSDNPEGDARLIAAAPDLRDALEHITDLFVSLSPLGAHTEREVAVVNARAALAKVDTETEKQP